MRHFRLFMITMFVMIGFLANGQTLINETFTSGIPADWTVVDNNFDSQTWSAYSNDGNTDSYSVSIQSWSTHDDYLITKQVTVAEGTKLSFAVKSHSSSYLEAMEVLVSTSTNDVADFTIQLADYPNVPFGWNEYELVLTDNASISAGDDIYIAFRCYSSSEYYIYLDDVKVFTPVADDLGVSSIAFDPNTIFDGDDVTITATIANNGTNDQTAQTVDFIVDGSSIGTQSVDVTAGSTVDASITWTATEGSHSVEVTVPTDDDDNNISLTENITVFSATAMVQDFEGAWPPTGWEADFGWSQKNWDPYEGANSAYVSSTTLNRLMTPKAVIDASSSINFWAKTGFGEYDIKLVYSTDKSTWADVPSGTISLNATYQNFNIDLSGITAGNYFLAFEYNLSYTSVYLDYVVGPEIAAELPEASTNPTPSDAATDITATTDLTWQDAASGGIPTSYKVYFGTDGDGTSTPTNIENGTVLTEKSFTPSTVLDYETTYYWQIVPTNSLGDATSCPIWSFTTQSNPITPIPFSENFTGVNNYTIPADWTSTNYFVYGDHGVGGTECLSVNMWSTTNNADVTTPPVGPLSSNGNQVKFDYRICDATYGSYPQTATTLGVSDKVEVQLSTDDGTTFSSIHTIDQNNHITNLDFVTVTLNLDAAYNSENIKLRFKNTWGEGDYNVDIDNIVIRELPTDPVMTISTDTLTYYNVPTNLAKTKSVTIMNDGGGTLSITNGDIVFSGTDAADFTLGTVTYPIELGAAESLTLDITLNTATAGNKEASLDITHNGTKTTTSIGLVGSTYAPFASYFEDFDTTAEDEIPEKWNMITFGAAGVYVITDGFSTYSYSAPNSLAIASGAATDAAPIAVTPAFEMGNKRLEFYAKKGTWQEEVIVGTITDPTDETSFTGIDTVSLTNDHVRYQIDFDNYAGSDMYVAFKSGASTTYNPLYIDNLKWLEIPTTPICEVTPLSIDFGEATVAETDSDIITIKNSGINTLTIAESDFTFTGTNPDEFSIGNVTYPIELNAEETIDITINFIPQTGGAKTADLEISHNGNNGTITVALEGIGYAGYVEDFNEAGTTFPPKGWTAEEGWKALTFSTYEGAGGAWFNPSSEATTVKLITPLLDVKTGDTFSFWAKKSNQDATFTVKYTADTTSGGTWTDLETFTITNTDYEEKLVDISSITDGEYYIAIAGSGVAFTSTYIDYVKAPSLAGSFDIEFNITEDGTGDPIEGAVVEINGETSTTDVSGYAVLSVNNGTHNYTISHDMHEDVTGSVVVNSAGQSIDVSMTAMTGYTVTFNVVDEDGNAFTNANININGTDLTTDASGIATIVLADGEYPYTATAAGYADVVDTLNVAGADLSESITLYEVYNLTFVVTDGTNPIEGAFVVVGSAVLGTDANGEASINALNGTYYYTVTKAYYETVSGEITINGADVTENVVIRPVFYVDFTVTDEESNPIEAAEITIEDSTITTNASGFASIELADGTYNYTIVKNGYDTIDDSFTVNGENIEINETMVIPQYSYSVTLTVKDQDDIVLEGALVELTDGTETWNATTDATGIVIFTEKVNGTYDYTVSLTDYETTTGQITVTDADVSETINIQYVSINDVENIQFTVYPNPGNGVYNIRTDGTYQLLVYNAIGNIVKTTTVSNETIIDIKNQPVGIYFFKILSENAASTQRIILE